MLNVINPWRRLVAEALNGVDFAVADVSDVAALTDLFADFFAEAGYKDRGIVYSPEAATTWLNYVIFHGTCPHVIARERDSRALVGVTSYSLDRSFCVDPVAVLHTLYVVPAWRKSAVGRVLVALSTEAAQGDGAVAFHAPLASGMSETKTLVNLFRRAGFDEIGVIMGRKL